MVYFLSPLNLTTSGRGLCTPKLSLGRALLAVLMLIGLLCAMPFLAGAQNLVGLIIIGIGLYEAWKLNRRVSMAISGPHPVNAAPATV
jgi:hypothetical protein